MQGNRMFLAPHLDWPGSQHLYDIYAYSLFASHLALFHAGKGSDYNRDRQDFD